MSQQEKTMRLALKAFDALYVDDYGGYEISKHERHIVDDAIEALRQALDKPDIGTQALVEIAVLAEREACAKVCEVEASVIVTNASEQYQEGRSMGATVCATAIRARGEK